MNKDLDIKLYNEYLNGNEKAIEILYNKYQNKIKYFVFNIVKDYQKSEDITQEVFLYVLQNKKKSEISFKYYIYLIAKSKSLNYINSEKRRTEINEQYFSEERTEKDVIDIIIKEEVKKELIESINKLDNKYRNAMYLIKIEELSYKETSEILGENIQNIKNLIHRGKKELRKILLKKGFDEMNKISKILIIVLCMSVLLSGVAYATYKLYENIRGKVDITPTYTSKLSNVDTNKVWIGTFNLVWNDFMNDVIGGPIEFEDGYSDLANELNKQTFTIKQLSEQSYYKIHGQSTNDLKNEIENNIKNKFNEKSKILDKVEWGNPESYVLYTMLKKEFNFLEKFPVLSNYQSFNSSEEKVKYFGIDASTTQEAAKNIEVLFYDSKDNLAIKLKTKEGEEVILYKTTGEGKSFEENFEEVKNKQKAYSGKRNFEKNDTIKIPFIKLSNEINYDELCGRMIKGTDIYIRQAIQTIDFELNNVGGSVKSEALIEALKNAISEEARKFEFDSDFILYLKEENKEKPYFALKVDNTNILEVKEK